MDVMARRPARGVLLAVALFFSWLALPGGETPVPAWHPVRLYQVNYISAEDLAARFDLKLTWLKKKQRARLESRTTKVELEVNDREISWNGLRICLSEPIAPFQDTLCLSLDDVRSTLDPLLRPGSLTRRPRPRLIAIDAGHGGRDTGTENHRLKLQEKTFTLDVARRLKMALEKLGYRTVLTRKSDRYVALEKRSDIANRVRADLFVSIHFNSLENNGLVQGVETYAFTPAGQRSTVAEVHRAADEKPQKGNRLDDWNILLGAFVQRQLVDDLHALDRGVKRARFVVLRATPCPSVLVEGGFLSNSDEAGKLATPAYREKIARAIAGGVGRYVGSLEPSGGKQAE
jgi:N-acetylmuramoyl-L-alanine amidase